MIAEPADGVLRILLEQAGRAQWRSTMRVVSGRTHRDPPPFQDAMSRPGMTLWLYRYVTATTGVATPGRLRRLTLDYSDRYSLRYTNLRKRS